MEGRQAYRLRPEDLEGHGLQLTVETAVGEVFEAEILDVRPHEVLTRFLGKRLPTLVLGEWVQLTFTSRRLPAPVLIRARARFGFAIAKLRRYGFEFAPPEELQQRLSEKLSRFFSWPCASRGR